MSVAFSPDGKTILTGSLDRTARRWDAASGQPIGPPMVHAGLVMSVAFSPDGKTIAAADFNRNEPLHSGGARLGCRHRPADRAAHAALSRLDGSEIRFSPDGRYLLMSDDQTAALDVRAAARRPATAGRLDRVRHRAGAGRSRLDPCPRRGRLAGPEASAGPARRAAAGPGATRGPDPVRNPARGAGRCPGGAGPVGPGRGGVRRGRGSPPAQCRRLRPDLGLGFSDSLLPVARPTRARRQCSQRGRLAMAR